MLILGYFANDLIHFKEKFIHATKSDYHTTFLYTYTYIKTLFFFNYVIFNWHVDDISVKYFILFIYSINESIGITKNFGSEI